MAGIYIHVPFCIKACTYCDFYFSTNHAQKDSFVSALLREIHSFPSHLTRDTITTIYFGGGTPSVLSAQQIHSVLEAIYQTFPHCRIEEITMEMNPEHISRDYLEAVKKEGISRVSVGIQSFEDEYLRFMNRAHENDSAKRALNLLSEIFPRHFTADLIFGLPDQTIERLSSDIDELLSFDPYHVSAYTLTVEENTKLSDWIDKGMVVLPNDELLNEMMLFVQKRMNEAELNRYEISNYARLGYESKHNGAYWNHTPYFGFGPSAHSFYFDSKGDAYRVWKQKNILRYTQTASWEELCESEKLTQNDLIMEFVMMGFRRKSGLNTAHLQTKWTYYFNDKQTLFLQELEVQGLLEKRESCLILTNVGMNISESIITRLMALG